MNKLSLSDNNSDKKIITFTINKVIKQKLRETLLESEKYNLKKKGDWINEAIVMLNNNPSFKEMVRHAEGSNKEFVLDKVYMTFQQRCLFSEIRNEVVKAFPDIKGPQASIIRAAILSRLTRRL